MFKTEGPAGRRRREQESCPKKKIKIPGCTSLPRKLFLFSNKAMKDERDKYFPIGEKLIEEGTERFHTQEVWWGRGENPHLPQNSHGLAELLLMPLTAWPFLGMYPANP